MLVLVIVLVVTNLVTLGVVIWLHLRPADHPDLDPAVAALLTPALRSASSSSTGTRRFITIEILNPIELAGTRGRLAGIAGSLAPGFTRRVVYDKALKMVRRHLADEHVVADVRLHVTTRPPDTPTRPSSRPSVPLAPRAPVVPRAPSAPGAPGAPGAPPRPATAGPPVHHEPVDLIKHDEDEPPPR